MTTLCIPHLRELCEEAAEGPWESRGTLGPPSSSWPGPIVVEGPDREQICILPCFISRNTEAYERTGRFIAAARTALPEALDRIEALEKVAEANIALLKVLGPHHAWGIGADAHQSLVSLLDSLRNAGYLT